MGAPGIQVPRKYSSALLRACNTLGPSVALLLSVASSRVLPYTSIISKHPSYFQG